ncbi:MAG TPA: SGNH/GDSL hydrolase family protein, partial [Candidatus Hydrogenedentes bacterium]|nr:SGNH/GDSL hydrolase family protein [Candidatus Hydrogenedentota bacterium]
LVGLEPGAELRFTFTGTLIGVSVIAGMDAGVVEYSIDGGPFLKKDLFDHYCVKFHRPVCHLFGEALTPGEHQLTLRIAGDRNAQSTGHAMRILDFVCN